MIYPTPVISKEVRKHLNSDIYRARPILINYPNYQSAFICLHPFLKIKLGHSDNIKFETGNWPNKAAIVSHCEPITWNEILNLTGIKDISSLDRALAFLHYANKFAEKSEYQKLMLFLKAREDIIPPQVDELPEIIENDILIKIQSLGYNSVFIQSEIEMNDQLKKIDELLASPNHLPSHVRIKTPDLKIIIAQDFDQRFTYILGEQCMLMEIIDTVNLEGFFCDKDTPESWSYYDIPETNRMESGERKNVE